MKNKAVYKKVLSYIGNYKFLLFLSIIFAFLSVVLTLYIPVLIGRAIDFIISEGNVDFNSINPLLLKAFVCIVITIVLQWLMNIINNNITYNVIRDMRKKAFDKIEVLPLSYIDSKDTGDIVSRVIADVDQFADGLLMGFTQFFTGIVTIIGTLVFMLYVNVWVTIGVVVLTPVSLLVARFIAKKTFGMFKLQSETRGEETAYINEMIGNQKVVDSYSMQSKCLEDFDEINERLCKHSLKAIFYSSITNPATRFVNGIVYAGVALIGSIITVSGLGLTVGGLTCMLSYANQYTKPFNEISGVITELQNAVVCASRLFELIEEKEIEPDNEQAIELKNPKGKVQFKNVSFSYDKNKRLIEDFNLLVESGKRVAIVGPTGCGKTTIINLLMRFYEIDGGDILIDDVSIKNMTRNSLRENFGMVLQDTWLKNGTIKDNIKIANEDATDEEVIAAAKASYAHSFIKRLPNGYDTVIGEDLSSLSTGQAQLLSIARIMLKTPPMLILDEATSSIDTRTEILIQNAFMNLMKNKTSFIVAHRLSTIKEADIILVMKDGKIIEKGNHAELLKLGGFYGELYNSQFNN